MAELYLGIDLGTTNSVIVSGRVMKSGAFKNNIIQLERKTEQAMERQATLPSAVFYQKDPKTGEFRTDVGNYAKGRYGIKRGYVAKSVKSYMGEDAAVGLAEEIPDKTPAEVSSQILKYMRTRGKAQHKNDEFEDIVITVPASFNSAQCQATLEAARLAGIDVDNKHDILLYEPKAVIYDLVNMQENGELASDIIDFEEEKNILVFDLGGGTLDVSLHRVGYNENDIMSIQDLAISRYTNIGGDDFDQLLADDLLEQFQKEFCITIPVERKAEARTAVLNYAEKLKVNISNDIANYMFDYDEMPDELETYVDIPFIYDSYGYSVDYRMSQAEEVVAPLLGKNLTIEDYKKIDSLNEKDMNNIIYPILDVLAKANKHEEVAIDAVVLNGGMTRFFPIKKRIDEFFGFESLVTNDPDLAVARGASYYHYLLHKYNVPKQAMFQNEETEGPEVTVVTEPETGGMDTGTILNDNINLGLGGEYLSLLVEEGMKLPYVSEEINDKYYFASNSDSLSIEIFLGRGKTKNLPNYRVSQNIVTFDKKYPANTPISFRVRIDSFRNMKLDVWVDGNRMELQSIAVDTNGKQVGRGKEVASKIVTKEKLELNAKGEINLLKSLAKAESSKNGKHQKSQKDKGNSTQERVNVIIERIGKASNKSDFFAPIEATLNELSNNDSLRAYMYMAANVLAEGWNDAQRLAILKCCKVHFKTNVFGLRNNHGVMRQAIQFIVKWDKDGVGFVEQLLEEGTYDCYINTIVDTVICSLDLENPKVMDVLSKCPIHSYSKQGIERLMQALVEKETMSMPLIDILLDAAEGARKVQNHKEYVFYLSSMCKVVEIQGVSNTTETKLVHVFKNWMQNETSDQRYHITHKAYNAILERNFSEELVLA
ncbi:MAG: Hsp70 family protein [bacterium]|nr:Hsp70 family protein [bacterium]